MLSDPFPDIDSFLRVLGVDVMVAVAVGEDMGRHL